MAPSGIVTGIATGSAVITATAAGVVGSADITVRLGRTATVTISAATLELSSEGGTLQLTAVLKEVGGQTIIGRPASWSSDSGQIATVNSSGLVTGIAAGTTIIRARSDDGVEGTINLRVRGLIHRWSFEQRGGAGTSLVDSVGRASATIVAAGTNQAAAGDGQVSLAGGSRATSDYVALPKGLLSRLTDATIEVWGTTHSARSWSRIFDFGSGPANNLFITWSQGLNLTSDRAAITANGVEVHLDNALAPYTLHREYHVVMTIDQGAGANGTTRITVYRDGETKGTFETTYTLSGLADDNAWLGRSQYPVDETANASYNEFSIYDRALTAAEVRQKASAGPRGSGAATAGRVAISSPSGTTIDVGASVALTALATSATGNALPYKQATWSSSNAAVASVSASGLVTGVAPGGPVTISATIDGQSASIQVTVAQLDDDLYVAYIQRLPVMDYVMNSSNPTREGWPSGGQRVTWRAQVANISSRSRSNVPYSWYLDGAQVSSGVVNLPADAYTAVDFPWDWTFTRHDLELRLDPDNAIPERSERNNDLTMFTDAISFGYWVEASWMTFMRQHQPKLGIGSTTLENWIQRSVTLWNQRLRDAVFSLTPKGVIDRIRLDKIVVVPDGALPLAGGWPAQHPDLRDRSVDLQWGLPLSEMPPLSEFRFDTRDDNWFYSNAALLHELGHARYLVDVYAWNIEDGDWTASGVTNRGRDIAIAERSALVAGSVFMPNVGFNSVYVTPMLGLMHAQYTYIDEYSAAALNLIAGRRATVGNTNAPGNLGAFVNDLPNDNRLHLQDQTGQPLGGASVRVYRAIPTGLYYLQQYDNVPDMQVTADASGRVLLGRNPFTASGPVIHAPGGTNSVIILRVEHQARVGYAFLESWRFNMEYWRGKTSLGEYLLKVNLIP